MQTVTDQEEDVELGAEVEVRRKPAAGSLVAVRIGRDLLVRINEYGHARGKTVSQVLRDGAEALINGQLIVNYVSISPPMTAPIEAQTYVVLGSPSTGGRTIMEEAEAAIPKLAVAG